MLTTLTRIMELAWYTAATITMLTASLFLGCLGYYLVTH